ncbi:MAG: hypothetical protein ACAI38_10455 [Myxococcota bacterium]
MGSWPHDTVVVDTVVDALVPTVEVTPFPATVVDRLVLVGAGKPYKPRHRHKGLANQLKVLAMAAIVLALVCAYAFGVLGRDTAVGAAQASAMTDPRRDTAVPSIDPPLETIPLGEPWFSAPPTAPEPQRNGRPRAK